MKNRSILTKKCGLTVEKALARSPELSRITIDKKLDLGNSEVLKLYNQLIFQDLMNLHFELPEGYLIPTICSRFEFLKYCLESTPKNVLEIGTGASAILALMMAYLGIQVTATEIDPVAYQSAYKNIKFNNLTEYITLIKSNGEIIEGLNIDTITQDLIICNPPQYDLGYFKAHSTSNRGFIGQFSELVGGEKGYEFILELLNEVNRLIKSPSVCFQLTLPKLQHDLEKELNKKKYTYSSKQIRIGTRIRIYYKVCFNK